LIQAIGVGDPSQAAGCDSGDAEGNSVALAQFLLTVEQQPDQSPVHVAETEQAEFVGVNADSLAQGLKPRSVNEANAALKRRSSTVLPTPVFR
jgi:hypothetical protein